MVKVCINRPRRSVPRVTNEKDACRMVRAAIKNGGSLGGVIRCVRPADYCQMAAVAAAFIGIHQVIRQIAGFLGALALSRIIAALIAALTPLPKPPMLWGAFGVLLLLSQMIDKIETIASIEDDDAKALSNFLSEVCGGNQN